MQKRRWMGTLSVVVVMGLSACRTNMVERTNLDSSTSTIPEEVDSSVTEGTQTYIGFLMDNVLHDETEGDIHYHIYIPDSYDGNEAYALFVTLPGYQGLYFQGVGENIRTEEFGFAAQNYNDHMIIVAPQLNDWRETSGRQTNVLTQYMIDPVSYTHLTLPTKLEV